MKIESYHKAYEDLDQCSREAGAMNKPQVQELVELARNTLWKAWSVLQEIENSPEGETDNDIKQAVELLSQSETGQEAIDTLQTWFRKGKGLSLDSQNMEAVSVILKNAWGAKAGTTLEYLEKSSSC